MGRFYGSEALGARAYLKGFVWTCRELNIGALIIRIGFGVFYTIIVIRNPHN